MEYVHTHVWSNIELYHEQDWMTSEKYCNKHKTHLSYWSESCVEASSEILEDK